MSTFLQVLRLAFWINPLQRVLTCVGVIALMTGSIGALLFTASFAGVPTSLAASFLVSASCLLMGGVYWRIASAPRIVRLAPRGRARLLRGVMLVTLLVAVLNMVPYLLLMLRWVGPVYSSPAAAWGAGTTVVAVLISVVVVGMFMASYSPLAALAVLIVVASPGVAVTLFDANLSRQVRPAPGAFALLALIWIPFAIWYLSTRRISPPRWLAGGGQDVLATALISSNRPTSQREARERLLLGGTTVVRLGLQWFVVLGLLLCLQWVLARVGEPGDPALVARAMYASLCICPIVTTVLSFAAIRRSRALWLLATSSRVEFFDCIFRTLMRLNLTMVLVFGIWLAAVWFAQPPAAGPLLKQHALPILWPETMWVLGMFAICAQLARLPKWPSAILATTTLAVVWWYSSAPEPPTFAGSLVAGLAAGLPLVIAVSAAIVLRWLAQLRWYDGDFPRAFTSPSAAS